MFTYCKIKFVILFLFYVFSVQLIGKSVSFYDGIINVKVNYDKEIYSIGDEMNVTIIFEIDVEQNFRNNYYFIPTFKHLDILYPHLQKFRKVDFKCIKDGEKIILSNKNPKAKLTRTYILERKIYTPFPDFPNPTDRMKSFVKILPIIKKKKVYLGELKSFDRWKAKSIILDFIFDEQVYTKIKAKDRNKTINESIYNGAITAKITYDKAYYSIGDEMNITINFNLNPYKNKGSKSYYIPTHSNYRKMSYNYFSPKKELKCLAEGKDVLLSNDARSATLNLKYILTDKVSSSRDTLFYISDNIKVLTISPNREPILTDIGSFDTLNTSSIGLTFYFVEQINRKKGKRKKDTKKTEKFIYRW